MRIPVLSAFILLGMSGFSAAHACDQSRSPFDRSLDLRPCTIEQTIPGFALDYRPIEGFPEERIVRSHNSASFLLSPNWRLAGSSHSYRPAGDLKLRSESLQLTRDFGGTSFSIGYWRSKFSNGEQFPQRKSAIIGVGWTYRF